MRNSKEKSYLVPELVLVRKNIPAKPIRVRTPLQAHRVLMSMWDKDSLWVEEHFAILLIDAQLNVIGYKCISQGTRDKVDVYIDKICRYALVCNAHSVILAHNHPTNIPIASVQDEITTMKIRIALRSFQIEVDDHLILGGTEHFTSMKQSGNW